MGERLVAIAISDAGSPIFSTTVQLPITVLTASLPPQAEDDRAVTVDLNQAVAIDVLANDSDPDGDVVRILDIDTAPEHGTAAIDDGGTPDIFEDDRIVYTPETDYVGPDTLVYRIGDGRGGEDTAVVTLNVGPVPNVAGLVINSGDAQRSRVTLVQLQFSHDVGASLEAQDLFLSNLTSNEGLDPALTNLSYDPLTRTASWTFPGFAGGALPEGDYVGTLGSADIFTAAAPLDGDGDGTGGDPFVFDFHVLLGDFDGSSALTKSDADPFQEHYRSSQGDPRYDLAFDLDRDGFINFIDLNNLRRMVNLSELDQLRLAIRSASPDPAFDVNHDAVVNGDDLTYQVEEVLGTRRGDANLDGTVDDNDLDIVRENLGLYGLGWEQGNFDLNDVVDTTDLAHVRVDRTFVPPPMVQGSRKFAPPPREPFGDVQSPDAPVSSGAARSRSFAPPPIVRSTSPGAALAKSARTSDDTFSPPEREVINAWTIWNWNQQLDSSLNQRLGHAVDQSETLVDEESEDSNLDDAAPFNQQPLDLGLIV